MKNHTELKANESSSVKEFWDSLKNDIIVSTRNLSQEDIMVIIERSCMFSIFFRGCSQMEIISYKAVLNLKNSGYILMLELSSSEKSAKSGLPVDDLSLHHFLKKQLEGFRNAISPMIKNRISILITMDPDESNRDFVKESLALGRKLICSLRKEYQIQTCIGIGNVYSLNSIYSSFMDALSCMQYRSQNQIVHVQEVNAKDQEFYYDYNVAERQMLDALRLHKAEAYDYFCILMNQIQSFNEDVQRNKILELLVLVCHSLRIDNPKEPHYFNYLDNFSELSRLDGEQLTNWAFQKFLYITGNEKPQYSIDYSNRVVHATKEFLEAHYAEDITLDDVAEQVNISPQYFSKLIKKSTGFNFIDWLSMLRVRKAKELLSSTNMTVKEVCYAVGYKDPNYFSRIFKKRIGLTPSEYAKSVARSEN